MLHALLLLTAAASAAPPDRRVAITVDDLPGVGPRIHAEDSRLDGIATELARRTIPAIGFVNGCRDDLAQAASWRDAGLAFGSHSCTHRRYSKLSWSEWETDLLRNQDRVREVLGVELSGGWFRYPFLDHGGSVTRANRMASWLEQQHTRLAPVSLDTVDYLFNQAYVAADGSPDVARLYVDAVMESAAWSEHLSRTLYEREVPLVLLIHATALNADHLSDVLDGLEARGYRFVTLAEALDDPAYMAWGQGVPDPEGDGDAAFLPAAARARGLELEDLVGPTAFEHVWAPRIRALAAGGSPSAPPDSTRRTHRSSERHPR